MIKSKKDMVITVKTQNEAERVKNIFLPTNQHVAQNVKDRFKKISETTWSDIADGISYNRQ